MTFVRSSRAIAGCPTWITTTRSRPRRSLACSALGSVACGVMRQFSPGATSSRTGAASSLVCSHPPPAPRVWVANPILTSRIAAFSTRSVPGHRTWCSRPFVAGEQRYRLQALVSWVKCEGALVGSFARWPVRGRKKTGVQLRHPCSPFFPSRPPISEASFTPVWATRAPPFTTTASSQPMPMNIEALCAATPEAFAHSPSGCEAD